MIKKVICIIGGLISIISVFLPVFLITYEHHFYGTKLTVYYWIFGQFLRQEKGEPDELYFPDIDILGTICMMIIITGSMLVIMNANENSRLGLIKGLIGGLIIIIAMISYTEAIISKDFSGYYYSYYYMTDLINYIRYSAEKVRITFSYGYYAAIIGGIVSIGGSIISLIPILKRTSDEGE